jgi:hypothetical protein
LRKPLSSDTVIFRYLEEKAISLVTLLIVPRASSNLGLSTRSDGAVPFGSPIMVNTTSDDSGIVISLSKEIDGMT